MAVATRTACACTTHARAARPIATRPAVAPNQPVEADIPGWKCVLGLGLWVLGFVSALGLIALAHYMKR